MRIADKALIADLHTIRCSTNPYNVNSLTAAAGIAELRNEAVTKENCLIIAQNRKYLSDELKKRGFSLTDSTANFVFARFESIEGKQLYLELKERGVLVRHFDKPRIKDFNRITVGTEEQINVLLKAIDDIIGGKNEKC